MAGLWADTDHDDDRLIKRRAAESHGPVERIARDLRDVAQHTRNADPQRIRRLVEVQGVLAKAAEQLKDLGSA